MSVNHTRPCTLGIAHHGTQASVAMFWIQARDIATQHRVQWLYLATPRRMSLYFATTPSYVAVSRCNALHLAVYRGIPLRRAV